MHQDQVDWDIILKKGRRFAEYMGFKGDDINEMATTATEHLLEKLKNGKYKKYPGSNFNSWSSKVVWNRMIDEIRLRKRRRISYLEPEDRMDEDAYRLNSEDYRIEFGYILSKVRSKLTPTEIKICELYIQEGKLADDEVANLLALQSSRSVVVHRSHIRSKGKSL